MREEDLQAVSSGSDGDEDEEADVDFHAASLCEEGRDALGTGYLCRGAADIQSASSEEEDGDGSTDFHAASSLGASCC